MFQKSALPLSYSRMLIELSKTTEATGFEPRDLQPKLMLYQAPKGSLSYASMYGRGGN